jgi:hypothetical protein
MTNIFDLQNLNDIPLEVRQQLQVEKIWEQETRLQNAIALRDQGFTYRDIALRIGGTKQGIQQLLRRNQA